MILTDGIRYGLFERAGDPDRSFPARPTAWLNLLRLRARYPLLECEGAVRVVELMAMGPGGAETLPSDDRSLGRGAVRLRFSLESGTRFDGQNLAALLAYRVDVP